MPTHYVTLHYMKGVIVVIRFSFNVFLYNIVRKYFNIIWAHSCIRFSFSVKSSCYGEVSSPISYFTSPSYPTTDYLPNYCTYTIKVDSTSWHGCQTNNTWHFRGCFGGSTKCHMPFVKFQNTVFNDFGIRKSSLRARLALNYTFFPFHITVESIKLLNMSDLL